MKFLFGLIASLTVLLGSFASAGAKEFRYDHEFNICVNENGAQGYNEFDMTRLVAQAEEQFEDYSPVLIYSNIDGECVDFRPLSLEQYLNPLTHYRELTVMYGWNLKGAILEGVEFRGAIIDSAYLQGAKFETMKVSGYISGYIYHKQDKHPPQCRVTELTGDFGSIECAPSWKEPEPKIH